MYKYQKANDGGFVLFDELNRLVFGFNTIEEIIKDYPLSKKIDGLFDWCSYES